MTHQSLKQKLIEVFVRSGMIPMQDIQRAEKLKDDKGIRFFQALIQLNLIEEKKLLTMVSSECGLPFLNLDKKNLDREVIEAVPEKLCRRSMMVPCKKSGKELLVA